MGTLLRFQEDYCAAVTKKYWALEKGEILNLTFFVLFSFFQLRNISITYCKYFQNNINQAYSSSAARRSTS